MKQIDHNPNEHKKMPDHGEKAYYGKQLGREPRPSDLLMKAIPLLFILVGLYGWRMGWWF